MSGQPCHLGRKPPSVQGVSAAPAWPAGPPLLSLAQRWSWEWGPVPRVAQAPDGRLWGARCSVGPFWEGPVHFPASPLQAGACRLRVEAGGSPPGPGRLLRPVASASASPRLRSPGLLPPLQLPVQCSSNPCPLGPPFRSADPSWPPAQPEAPPVCPPSSSPGAPLGLASRKPLGRCGLTSHPRRWPCGHVGTLNKRSSVRRTEAPSSWLEEARRLQEEVAVAGGWRPSAGPCCTFTRCQALLPAPASVGGTSTVPACGDWFQGELSLPHPGRGCPDRHLCPLLDIRASSHLSGCEVSGGLATLRPSRASVSPRC